MTNCRSVFIILLIGIASLPEALVAQTDGRSGGMIAFLQNCPGDKVQTSGVALGAEGITSILSPIITGSINTILSRIGSKLKESSEEQKVDSLSTGSHLYKRQGDQFTPSSWCIVIASKVTKNNRKTTLDDLMRGYMYATVTTDPNKNSWDMQFHSDMQCSSGNSDCQTFQHFLRGAGYSSNHKPGLLAVFDLQLSNPGTEFRFVPRFVSTDHSLRESRSDTRPRDFTYEIAITIPGQEESIAAFLLKFEGLRPGRPYTFESRNGVRSPSSMASDWASLPEIGEKELDLATEHSSAIKQRSVSVESANLAAYAIKGLTGALPKTFSSTQVPCNSNAADYQQLFLEAKGELATLAAKATVASPLSTEIAIATNKATYYAGCVDIGHATSVLTRLFNSGFKDGYLARSFSVSVDIKEFRKRPVIEFFADVLINQDTRTALSEQIAASVDPETRRNAANEKAAVRQAALESLETVKLAAETAILAYETAAEEDKASKFMAMESAKRTANRKAQSIDAQIPYPEAGLWL